MKKTLCIVFILLSVYAKGQQASEIISRYIAYTGGTKPWTGLKSIVINGEYNYNGIKFPFYSFSKAPNLYKFKVPLKGKYFEQGYNGKSGWKIDAFKNETVPKELYGKDALAMMNEADVEIETPLLNYLKKGHAAASLGKQRIDNIICYKIKFTRKTGEVEYYFFDARSYQLVMKSATSKNSELNKATLDTYYTDYRDVGDLKLPFIATSKIKQRTILTVTISNIKLNEAIEDKEFQINP